MSTSTTADRKRPSDGVPRYGDYPELFWDLQPDAPVEVDQPFVLARLLTQASPEVIRKLVPVSLIRRELPTLPIPEHTRTFWGMVLDALDRPAAERSRAAGA